MKRTYAAAPGSRLSDDDAQIVGEVITRIEKARGGCTPQDLVEHARHNKDSRVHALIFDVSDKQAADEYRLSRARWLVRSIVVRIEVEHRDPVVMRPFVSVPTSDGTGQIYVGIARAMRDPDYRASVLENAKSDLESFRRKYNSFRELAEMNELLEAVETALRRR